MHTPDIENNFEDNLAEGTLTLNSCDTPNTSGTTIGTGSLSPTGWPRATLVCRPNSHPFQVYFIKTSFQGNFTK